MQLVVRKVPPHKARTTRKQRLQWKQRGGALWNSIETAIGTRKDKWKDEIAKKPEHQKLFGALFEPVDTEDKKKVRLEQWLNCMMYEEQLFDIAFDLYINNGKEIEYFADVVRFINFGFGTATAAAKSKIDLLYSSAKSTKEDESGLKENMLDFFESAFPNAFITSLASFINMIKANRDQLKIDSAVLSRYLLSISRANSLLLTGYDMIDGFYLDQGKKDFGKSLGSPAGGMNPTTKPTFFIKFIDSLKAATTATDISTYYSTFRTTVPPVTPFTTSIWFTLAACVAALHFKDDIKSVLTLFNSPNAGSDAESFTDSFAYIPDKDQIDIELSNKLNIYNIMKTIAVQSSNSDNRVGGENLLQFVVHLAKRCVELEKGDKFEMKSFTEFFTAPAPPSP